MESGDQKYTSSISSSSYSLDSSSSSSFYSSDSDNNHSLSTPEKHRHQPQYSEKFLNQKSCQDGKNIEKMFDLIRDEKISKHPRLSKQSIFYALLILSVSALVILHNGSLLTRKTSVPEKFFSPLSSPFITDYEKGELKELWSVIAQNDVAFTFFYAPWDSDSIRAKKEFETVANHYEQRIFFAAINCWWPDGECSKYQSIRRYPLLVAHIRNEGDVQYTGPILASYITPFLENVISPVVPLQNEGELLDYRATHDSVLVGYFNFMSSPHQPGYRAFVATAIKALVTDPWRVVSYTVVTNPRIATKLNIDPSKESSLILFIGNSSEVFTAKSSKPAAILSWVYTRANRVQTLKWISPSGIKSKTLGNYLGNKPTLILFTPRSFIFGISPYFDLLREVTLDYYNCDNSPVVRSLIHRNILRRRLLEEKLSDLEERCHELLDDDDANFRATPQHTPKYNDNEQVCCHTQTVPWRSYGGARRGMKKNCLCTSCVHISLPKCPARCNHFDCFSTVARYLNDFDPNSVNNSATYCNQIKSIYEPKYTSYYKVSTTCSGLASVDNDEFGFPSLQQQQQQPSTLQTSDEKITKMIKDVQVQHCRRLKLGMNYTDLNFPDSGEGAQNLFRGNFTGLGCRTNRSLNFIAIDSALFPALAEAMGIDVFNIPHSTVAVITDHKNEVLHVLNHDIVYKSVEIPNFESKEVTQVPINSYSKKAFVEFIKNFTANKLPRFHRSQIIQSTGVCDLKQNSQFAKLDYTNSNVICVPELNTETFTSFILGKTFAPYEKINDRIGEILEKDIVVMYYAPWCGFCTSIAHIYLEVARSFAYSNQIIFARINGDANDLPWEYTVDRYPTIMFFPAKKRSNSVLFPATEIISKESLTEFILGNAQLPLRIQTALLDCKGRCLKETIVGTVAHKRHIIRSIRHNRQVKSLAAFEIQAINNEIVHIDSRSKDAQRLRKRVDSLKKFYTHSVRSLNRLHRLFHRTSLLQYFAHKHAGKLAAFANQDDETWVNELSEQIQEEVFHKKNSDVKSSQVNKHNKSDKVLVKTKSTSKPSSKATRKDEL